MVADVAPSTPLLQNLNPEQLAAVTLPDTHALILAGAGSGKTRVLTTRIAWLLQTGQVTPGGVLAVTFTNKAAKEMMLRLTGMLPVNVRGMWIGTFHGLCNRFLRAHYKMANLPQSFQILDTQDQLSAIQAQMDSLTTVFMLAGTTGMRKLRPPSVTLASHSERLSTRHLRGSSRMLS